MKQLFLLQVLQLEKRFKKSLPSAKKAAKMAKTLYSEHQFVFVVLLWLGVVLPIADYHASLAAPENTHSLYEAVTAEAEPQIRPQLPEIADVEFSIEKEYKAQITVYHSVPWETDGDPWTTASGSRAREGVVAANCLPIGTLLRIPDQFGDQVFRVEDRLAPRKGCNIIDVWRPYDPNNRSFGAPLATIEILDTSHKQSLTWAVARMR